MRCRFFLFSFLLFLLSSNGVLVGQGRIASDVVGGFEIDGKKDVDSLVSVIEETYLYKGTYASSLVRGLYRYAQEKNDVELMVISIHWDALIAYTHRSDKSLLPISIDSLLMEPAWTRNSKNVVWLEHALALSELAYGNYSAAMLHAMGAYRQAEMLKETDLIAMTASTLGNIGTYIQDYELSRLYYEEALAKSKKGSFFYHRTEINLYNLYAIEGHYDSAIMNLKEIMSELIGSGDSSLLGICYLNMGSYYAAQGLDDSAYACYNFSLDLIRDMDNNNIRLMLYGNIGNCFRDRGQYDQAEFYYRESRRIALLDNNMDIYASMAYKMSVLYAKQGLIDSSYHYLSEYNELMFRIQQPQTAESYRYYADMVMELSDNRIKLSEKTVELRNKQLILLGVTAAGALLAIFQLGLVMAERRRSMRKTLLLKEIENKELSDRLAYERQIKTLQEEKMAQNVRELTSYSLLLANKNSLLTEVSDVALRAEKEGEKDGYGKIRKMVEENLHTDGDYWERFMVHFVQVDPNFFDHLHGRFPDLSKSETKLCAYIRIGMSPKQIAQMLNLSPDSVLKNRYRLRKKLGLDKDEALDETIRGL